MASVILCGSPAVVCNEIDGGVKSLNTLTGALTLTATGAVISPAGPSTLNIAVPNVAGQVQTPTFVETGGIINLGPQNSFATGTSIEIPLTWSATLAGILNPAGPAPPAGSGVSLGLGGFSFYVPIGANGVISAQLTDGAGINYPVLQPLVQLNTAVGVSSVGIPDVLVPADGLHASGMPVAANAVYLRITNGSGQTINLVSIPAEIPTTYYPSVAP